MKVVLINHSDTAGGASVVTFRLMKALCAEGVDARMLVVKKNTDSLRVAEIGGKKKTRIHFLAEHAEIFLRNGRNRETLFKISTGRYGISVANHPWVRAADVVMINWINQGMLSLKGIREIARTKPVIWTMHDMWNMTGVCHYSAGCMNWKTGCKDCPLTGPGKMASSTFAAKQRLYSSAPIHFVSVSNKLASLCAESPLMSKCDVSVIPVALPVDRFRPVAPMSRLRAGLPEKGRLIVMGAARLDDPVKNLPLAIAALNNVRTPDVTAVFYGNIRNREMLDSLRMPYVWLGRIADSERLQAVMAHADVVLSTSVWETFGATLAEGIASGAVAVATDTGGQGDAVEQGKTGYLVDVGEGDTPVADRIARAIEKALELPVDEASRNARHLEMARLFGAPAVARAYVALINRILTANNRDN